MQNKENKYYFPEGGLSTQKDLSSGRAVFKSSYAVIPKDVMQDIVVSYFPRWHGTRAWVLARPLSGFSQTFSQSVLEISAGGGSEEPEDDKNVECVLFVVNGELDITVENTSHRIIPGSYVYVPPGMDWGIKNISEQSAHVHWIRKIYQTVVGLDAPNFFVKNDKDVEQIKMPLSNGVWSTTRFVDPLDMRHDMHVNIVNIAPGGSIPFMETHVKEHGIYVLQGKGVYRLNQDWVEVEAGDFLWLRAFCPQACYAGGPEEFRYLLYKDVNRQIKLG